MTENTSPEAEGLRRAHEDQRRKDGKPPMKPDPCFDQAADNAYRVTAEELRAFVERYERLASEKQDIADQQTEVMAEAKARGYVPKILRKVIALRKRDSDDIAEEEAVLEMNKEGRKEIRFGWKPEGEPSCAQSRNWIEKATGGRGPNKEPVYDRQRLAVRWRAECTGCDWGRCIWYVWGVARSGSNSEPLMLLKIRYRL